MIRYPWEPLQTVLRSRLGPSAGVPAFAALFGEHKRQINRWRSYGLAWDQADRLACQLGLHPYEVWPNMVEDGIASLVRECAASDCAATFILYAGRGGAGMNRKYCEPRCARREAFRRRYADPVQAARHRARVKRYQQETNDYQNAQRRRRRAERATA